MKKKKIAIVDDHAMFRKSLANLINCFTDCEVIIEATHGVALQELLHPDSIPDIVLMDIAMPTMDGYQTTAWLRDSYPNVKVLALSTMSNDQAIINMIRQGARGYILKDADPKELRYAMDELMQVGYFYNSIVSREMVRTLQYCKPLIGSMGTTIKLTPRELTFLELACSDKSYQQIADEMSVSMRTVDGYRDALFRRFKVNSRVGMVLYGLRNDFIKL